MKHLKDILLKDLTPAQLKEVDKGVKALIRSSETVKDEPTKKNAINPAK